MLPAGLAEMKAGPPLRYPAVLRGPQIEKQSEIAKKVKIWESPGKTGGLLQEKLSMPQTYLSSNSAALC